MHARRHHPLLARVDIGIGPRLLLRKVLIKVGSVLLRISAVVLVAHVDTVVLVFDGQVILGQRHGRQRGVRLVRKEGGDAILVICAGRQGETLADFQTELLLVFFSDIVHLLGKFLIQILLLLQLRLLQISVIGDLL